MDKEQLRDFALNEAIMDQRGVNWIVENTKFYELQANEWIAEINANLINWWLLGLFDEATQENQKVVATRKTIVNGDEMWHLKLRENEK